jgi:hypothetical protein
MSPTNQIILGFVVCGISACLAVYGGYLVKSGFDARKPKTETAEDKKPDNVYDKLPLFDFGNKREYQDQDKVYYDDVLLITNKGEGQAVNVTVVKQPLPDNKQKVAISGTQIKVNKHISKKLGVLGINETTTAFRERGYNGKNVRIHVRFRNIFGLFFEFTYEGELNDLRLVKRLYISKESGEKITF